MTKYRLVKVLAWASLASALSAPAKAQDRLTVGTLEVVASGAGFGSTVGPAGALAGQLAEGGRFGLLDRVIDRSTGAEIEFVNAHHLRVLTTDPARPRAFFTRHPNLFLSPDAVLMADLRTGAVTHLLDLPATPGGIVQAYFAVDAQRLVVSYPDGTGVPANWAVVDVGGSAPASHSVTLPASVVWGGSWWTLSPDGTRIYRAETDLQASTSAVVAYDLGTGAEVSRRSMPFALSATLSWSDALDALVDARSGPPGMAFTALTRDLQTLGTGVVPTTGACAAQAVVSPATGRLYTFTGGGSYFGMALPATLTGSRLGSSGPVDVSDVDPEAKVNCGGVRVASPPGSPRRFRASVSGSTVSFAWENVGAASRFTLDADIAPGRTDVSLALGPDSHVTLAGVPPGTYYVRVRGANTFGVGAVSQEVTLVVP